MDLCTIATPRTTSAALALCESYLATNSGQVHLLLLDTASVVPRDARMHVHHVEEILDASEAHHLGALLIPERFVPAIRPRFLSFLLRRQPKRHVLDLPPGTIVLGDLEPVATVCADRAFLTIPRTLAAPELDGLMPDAIDAAHGVFDTDVLAVGPGSMGFLDWWNDCVAQESTFAERGAWHRERDWLAVDWVATAVGAFDPVIDRSPANHLSRFTVPTARPVEGDGVVLVDGDVPARWVDLRFVDHTKPFLFDAASGAIPRVLLSDFPALRPIVSRYIETMQTYGWTPGTTDDAWTYGHLPSGERMTDIMRATYFKGCVFATNFSEEPPPDPFAEEMQFLDWLRHSRRANDPRGVSRYLQTLWEFRPDLQAAMPDIYNQHVSAEALVAWASTALDSERDLPARLRPPQLEQDRAVEVRAPLAAGVNVAGFLTAAKGLGEAGRAVLSAVASAGIEHSAYNFGRTPARKEHLLGDASTDQVYDTNVICINAEMMTSFAESVGPDFFLDRHNIGVWFWEAGSLHPAARAGIDLVDEIWVTAPYVADVFAKETDKPIHIMPLPVTAPPPSAATRSDLGIPDGFMFLFVFDFFSTIERKNPTGLVEAFTKAFAPNEGPILVLKSINGDRNRAKFEELRYAIGDREDILLIDEFLPADQKSALINLCDCYTSLHRGEGFGLGMAEAMMLDKPVIGTGYSGNLAFMNENNSFLVDYTLTRISHNDGLYPEGGEWADPDIDHAARLMRHVVSDPEDARRKASQGRDDVVHALHPDRLVEFVTTRFAARPEPEAVNAVLVNSPAAQVRSRISRPHWFRPRRTLRAVRRKIYWLVARPLFARLDNHSSLRDECLTGELRAFRASVDQLHERLDQVAADASKTDSVLLHAQAASEYARIAARRAPEQRDS